tara:strand:- start:91 stop:426 length:336 start_codon:yes stop_codon:yes gene_type:complete
MAGAGVEDLDHRQASGNPLTSDQDVACGQSVPTTQGDRIHTQGISKEVHLRLMGETGLHGTKAPHGTARRIVSPDCHALNFGGRNPIGAGGEAGRVGKYGGTRRGIGAAIE